MAEFCRIVEQDMHNIKNEFSFIRKLTLKDCISIIWILIWMATCPILLGPLWLIPIGKIFYFNNDQMSVLVFAFFLIWAPFWFWINSILNRMKQHPFFP